MSGGENITPQLLHRALVAISSMCKLAPSA
ncbi:hypothetical protein RHOER0001_5880 [Rhodococcus erythropolis SK121]|nr:hypothetical protein RHOER0001_5880 [Rhodococcus erythropolis SK121]